MRILCPPAAAISKPRFARLARVLPINREPSGCTSSERPAGGSDDVNTVRCPTNSAMLSTPIMVTPESPMLRERLPWEESTPWRRAGLTPGASLPSALHLAQVLGDRK